MKRELLALGLTVSIVFSLLVVAQPTGAVLVTVSGPDQVDKPDRIAFATGLEIREDERLPVERFDLEIATTDDESVTVTFAPNGTILSVDPAKGVVGNGEIKIERLRKTIEITPIGSGANYGYAERTGEDELSGESQSFGYGYGYGEGDLAYEIEIDSRAFKHGEYQLQVSVDGAFTSEAMTFEVGPGDGSGPADRGSGQGVASDQDRNRGDGS